MKVAVAIIFNENKEILITQRALSNSHGGLWEFPGGKLEADELPAHALIREIKEEVGIHVISYQFLGEIRHDYNGKQVELLIFLVEQYKGIAQPNETQLDLRWVRLSELTNYEFPAANLHIIDLIKQTSGELRHEKLIS